MRGFRTGFGFSKASSRLEEAGKLLDDLSPTAAWSFSRDLLTSFAASSRQTESGGLISSWNDQTGNGRHLTDLGNAALSPALITAGPQSRACADFTNEGLHSAATLASFISATSGYIIMVVILDAYTGFQSTIDANPAFLLDTNGVMGLFAKPASSGAATGAFSAYNHDGVKDYATLAATAGTLYVMEWRHESGTLYLRLNKGTWQSIASGNTTLTGTIRMGYGPSANWLDGKIFEAFTFSTVPDATTRDALIDDCLAWYA